MSISHIHIPAYLLKLNVQGLYSGCVLSLIHNFSPKGLKLSNAKLAEALSVDKRTIERVISRLKKKNYIKDVGKGRNGRCLVLNTDILSGIDTDKTTGSDTDNLSAKVPTLEVVSADKTTGHNKRKKFKRIVAEPSFSFLLKSGETWSLHNGKLSEYKQTYPNIDVESELRKASQWLRDNPSRRKTAKGMPRFINAWLSRAQPNGNNSVPFNPDTAKQREKMLDGASI